MPLELRLSMLCLHRYHLCSLRSAALHKCITAPELAAKGVGSLDLRPRRTRGGQVRFNGKTDNEKIRAALRFADTWF